MNSAMNDQKVKVEYFGFEQDFMEDNIRCIPMIVRYKLDACGIKLKLKEWSKMSVEEREHLATTLIDTEQQLQNYREYLEQIIAEKTGEDPTYLSGELLNQWMITDRIPSQLLEKLSELKMCVTVDEWKNLSVLQRYALVKLTRASHENKNFPKAMKEFGLI